MQALLLADTCCAASLPPGLQRLAMRDSSKEAVRALMLAAMGERQGGGSSSRPLQCLAAQPAVHQAVALAQTRRIITAVELYPLIPAAGSLDALRQVRQKVESSQGRHALLMVSWVKHRSMWLPQYEYGGARSVALAWLLALENQDLKGIAKYKDGGDGDGSESEWDSELGIRNGLAVRLC